MPSRSCRAASSPPCWRWCTRLSPAPGIAWWTSSPSRWAGHCSAPTSGSTPAALETRGESSGYWGTWLASGVWGGMLCAVPSCRVVLFGLFRDVSSISNCAKQRPRSRNKDQALRRPFDGLGTRARRLRVCSPSWFTRFAHGSQSQLSCIDPSIHGVVGSCSRSSELGVLSKTAPRLVTRPWRTVPAVSVLWQESCSTCVAVGSFALLRTCLSASVRRVLAVCCANWHVR